MQPAAHWRSLTLLVSRAVRRSPRALALLLTFVACGPEGDESGSETATAAETGSEAMTCAKLPEGTPVLRAVIKPDEPAITIAIAEETNDECALVLWDGTLLLPANIATGTYTLSEAVPSLHIGSETVGSCMDSQSSGVDAYTTGTVIITAATSDCVVGEIDAQTVDADGVATEYHGVFAAEPRK